MPNITPHVCRHTYCSKQARAGMNPKTLQYLMGYSDIGVTMSVHTHLSLEYAAAEMARMAQVEEARKEQEKLNGMKEGKEKQSRKMFRVVWKDEAALIAIMAVGAFPVYGIMERNFKF